MVDKGAFLVKVEEIAAEEPSYRSGGSGTDGTCDCIGLIIGAIRRAGGSWTGTHGSNYSARSEMVDLLRANGAVDLSVGEVVYKAHEPGESGYKLPAKYRTGGRSYNGDLRDYYHVGVVESVSPLRIRHMTTPKPKLDTKLGKWAWHGKLMKINYGSDGEDSGGKPSGDEEDHGMQAATVWSANGGKVKLRASKVTGTAGYRLYDELPVGTAVEVVARGDQWTQVNYGRRKGWYIQTVFLVFGETTIAPGEGQEDPAADGADDGAAGDIAGSDPVTITLQVDRDKAAILLQLLDALVMQLAEATGGRG